MRKHRRQRRRIAVVLETLESGLSHLRVHPLRLACFGALGLALFWLVLTKSLPDALAPSAPDLALALNPNNPIALIAKAERVRAQLLKSQGAFEQAGLPEGGLPKSGTIAHLPEAEAGSVPAPAERIDGLRREIRRLAVRTIANDPLNTQAFRLLAEATDRPDGVSMLMQEALKRSRRNAFALLWLLNDRAYHKDFRAALDHADMLLRTHPELSSFVLNYLALIAEDPKGSPLLVQQLAKAPAWRPSFFAALPQHVKQPSSPLSLMVALKEDGTPPTNKELAPYLNFLINKNLIDAAYNAWLQFLPRGELDTLGLITHPNFEQDPSGLPFDWQIARGLNSVAELLPLGSEGERAFHVSFGMGRVQFPEVSQVVLLAPGKYRLEGKLRGSIIAKRGLRWQLRCASGARRSIGETEMLLGQSQEWRVFSLEVEIPPTEDCRGQTLRLFHDSRSASEEFISGEVWFTGLRLERVPEPTVVLQ